MYEKQIDIFRALSDMTRQEILELLAEHDACVNELCKKFERMTQPTVSHHLQILRHCDLVKTERKGKMVYYSINKKVLRDGFESFMERLRIQIP